MNVMTSRFGSLNVQESDVVRLTEGLVGFRSSTQFLLLADQKVDGLYWLQSLDTPELAFALVTPGEGLED
jgi:flagellar assembly factor FliW